MLWRSEGATWVPVNVPVDRDNASYYPVQAIAQDSAGRLWVSVVRGGVYRLADGSWTRFGDAALSLASGEDGRVWLGYPHSRIRLVEAGGDDAGRMLTSADGLDIGNVLSILPGSARVWVGGELGVALFDGERFHVVAQRGGAQLPTVSGIVATPDDELWLSTSEGALHVSADEVRRLTADPGYEVHYARFDFLDGMPGTPDAIRPLPSIAAGTDGRLWFATSNGIVWIDPGNIRRNTLAPDVAVQSVVADGVHYGPAAALTLPIGVRNLQIERVRGARRTSPISTRATTPFA
jgi:ligand-binding sensor domain-containing protein